MQQPQACASQRPERLLPDDFWMFSYKVSICRGGGARCGLVEHESLCAQTISWLLGTTEMIQYNHQCICGGL